MHRVIEEIIEANKWRDGEFAKFKINASNVEELLWCRMCVPMIYAHWEGYVVSSLKILINYLNSLRLMPLDVKTNWIVLGLGNSYGFLSGKQSFEQKVEFTERFHKLLQDHLKFERRIDTKSNLKSDVLKEICKIFSFDFEKFSNYTRDIDQLVNVRNSIAHGENSILPNMINIANYIKATSSAMDIFLEEIAYFLENKIYLRNQ